MNKTFKPERKVHFNILVLGHKDHGKGTFIKYANEFFGIPGISSSVFMNDFVVFPKLAPLYGYQTPAECYVDRDAHRPEWFNIIADANPTGIETATSLLVDHVAYDGMRNDFEYDACDRAGIFHMQFWVDAAQRKPLESEKSMKIKYNPQKMILVDNNGPEEAMREFVRNLPVLKFIAEHDSRVL